MAKIKICGITNIEDALAVDQSMADAIGFIFASSPRAIEVSKAKEIISALSPSITKVGVFVNESPDKVNHIAKELSIDLVQLHGDENPQYCEKIECNFIKAFRIKNPEDLQKISDFLSFGFSALTAARFKYLLLDSFSAESYGGTGVPFNWDIPKQAAFNKPVILSGGLNADNLVAAIETVTPYAVDLSSKLEISPGKKDHGKIKTAVELAHGGCIMTVRGLLNNANNA